MPKVSVIVPVYNAEKYLSKCINSIANQTMKDIEIIMVNDGSTDSSLEIIEKYQNLYKNKMIIIDKKNGGAGSARNIGLDIATGEFIKFVDADDYLKLDVIDKMYNIAKEHKVSLVRGNNQTIIGPFKTIDTCSWSNLKGNQIVDVRKNKDYIITESPGIGNKLINRRLFDDLRFPDKTKWEDLAIMPVVIASSEKIYHMDEPVYNYRVNMNTTISDFINAIPNILDIIRCTENIENKMIERGLSDEYKSQIESLYILHTLYRIENAMVWVNFPRKKKEIIVTSLMNILDLKYPNWRENKIVEQYKKVNILFNIDISRINTFYREKYEVDTIDEAELSIKKVFK